VVAMSDRTKIQWTDATWNPVTGCTKVSPGCAHCYAEAMTKRSGGDFSEVTLHPDRLDQPLRWRKPRRIFVCSMGDLFHEDVPSQFIYHVFSVMRKASQHTFLVLTKRPGRMRAWIAANNEITVPTPPNVWLGVSVEQQRAAEERIPLLLQTPAAVRFVSCEPLLESVDLRLGDTRRCFCGEIRLNCDCPNLNWVIAGGESGPGARSAQLEWFHDLRDECRAAGVPLFVKQMGSVLGRELGCCDRKGGDMEAWPEDLRVREWRDAR